MFNVILDYPSYEEEQVIKNTTSNKTVILNKILDAKQIISYQQLVRKIPVANNVIEYAVKLVAKHGPTLQWQLTE